MSVVVSVVSVVSVSGECQWFKYTTGVDWRQRRKRPAEYPGHAVSATVVRPGAVARPCRGATGAVPATWRWPARATANRERSHPSRL